MDNLRLLCRSHNRHAAELELGREHIERAIIEARRRGVTAFAHRKQTRRASGDEGNAPMPASGP